MFKRFAISAIELFTPETIATSPAILGITNAPKRLSPSALDRSGRHIVIRQGNDWVKDGDGEGSDIVAFDYDPENFVYFRCRAITADSTNGNGDYFPVEELKKSYKSFVGVGLFKDHDSQSVDKSIGKVLWAEWVEEGKYVECYCALDKKLEPEMARRVESGHANTVSMGCMVGTAICSVCDNVAHNQVELCAHMRPGSGIKGRKEGDKVIHEINKDIKFTELSLVTVPADPTAHIFEVFAKKAGMDVEEVKYLVEAMVESKMVSAEIGAPVANKVIGKSKGLNDALKAIRDSTKIPSNMKSQIIDGINGTSGTELQTLIKFVMKSMASVSQEDRFDSKEDGSMDKPKKALTISYLGGSDLENSFFLGRDASREYKVTASDVVPYTVQKAILVGDPTVASPDQITVELNEKCESLEDFRKWAKRRKAKNRKVLERISDDVSEADAEVASAEADAEDAEAKQDRHPSGCRCDDCPGKDYSGSGQGDAKKKPTEEEEAAAYAKKVAEEEEAEAKKKDEDDEADADMEYADAKRKPKTDDEDEAKAKKKDDEDEAKAKKKKLDAEEDEAKAELDDADSEFDDDAELDAAMALLSDDLDGDEEASAELDSEVEASLLSELNLSREAMGEGWAMNPKEMEKEPKPQAAKQALPSGHNAIDEKEAKKEQIKLPGDKGGSGSKLKKFYGRWPNSGSGSDDKDWALDYRSRDNAENKFLKTALDEEKAKNDALAEKENIRVIADKIYEVFSKMRDKNLISAEGEDTLVRHLSKKFKGIEQLEALSSVIEMIAAPHSATASEEELPDGVVPQIFESVGKTEDAILTMSKIWNK